MKLTNSQRKAINELQHIVFNDDGLLITQLSDGSVIFKINGANWVITKRGKSSQVA